MSDFNKFRTTLEEKKGLWDNIHAKRKRGEKMRKPGEEGAPTDQDFKNAQKKESVEEAKMSPLSRIKKSGVVKSGSMSKGNDSKPSPEEVAAYRASISPKKEGLDITEISLDMLTKKISNSGMATTKKANNMDKTKKDLAALRARLAGKPAMAKEAYEEIDEATVKQQKALKALMTKALGGKRAKAGYTSYVGNNGDFVVYDGGGRIVGRIKAGEFQDPLKEEIDEAKLMTQAERIKALNKSSKAKMKSNLVKLQKAGKTNEEVELDEARTLAKKNGYEFIASDKDESVEVKYKNKFIARGGFDRGADGWFMSIKGQRGQKFFRNAKDVVDYFDKNNITESYEDNEPASPDEASMAMRQLGFIEYAAEEVMDHIKSGKEFPEWMQNKLSKLHGQMESLHSALGDHGEDDDEMKEAADIEEAKRKGAPKMRRSLASLRNEGINTADRKPEKFVKPDGKVGIRMVPVNKQIVDKDA